MSGKIPPDGPESSIDLAAAEWLVRRDRGFTAAEQDEFFHWLAEDPRHGEWLALHQQTWREFNLLAEWRPEHSSEPNPDLLARRPGGRRWLWPALAAIAASLVLSVAVWRPWAKPAAEWTELTTASAIQHRVLADGSELELNRGALIAVEFTPTERRVHLLRGEVHFAVAKNPLRPFIVYAGGVNVRAVGTAFDVRLDRESIEVLVTEGHVQVQPPTATLPVLSAGQRTVVSFSPDAPAPRVQEVSTEEIAQRLAWQPQLLDFSSTSLDKVVAEFNRRAGPKGVKLVIADPELGTVPIVASVRSDNIDSFVRSLELTAGVRAERRGTNEIVLHRAR